MSEYHNEAGEPLMTNAQMRLEQELDDMTAQEDAAGLNFDPCDEGPPVAYCTECDEPVWRQNCLDERGWCEVCCDDG